MKDDIIIVQDEESTKKKRKTKPKKEMPKASTQVIDPPEREQVDKELPEADRQDKEMPEIGHPENVVEICGKKIEIKATALRYQRDHTAMFYRVLDLYPLPDLLATEKGVFDPDRDGDKCLFDWLCAVFNDLDGTFVKKYYNDMDTEVIDQILKIYKRVNKIDEKEEQAKNRAAKAMSR